MSDDTPAEGGSSYDNAAGANRQEGTRGLSVQGRTGDVYYYAGCGRHAAMSTRRRTADFSPVPYETLRAELHRIVRACSRMTDDLRDDSGSSGGSPWD